MKKVLFLTHVGDLGGAEIAMLSLCQNIKQTCEVTYFQNGNMKQQLDKYSIKSSLCLMPEGMMGFKKENGFLSIVKTIPGCITMIGKLYNKGKGFDVIVCMSQKSFVLASLAKPFSRKPILWYMNDLLSPEHFNKNLIKILTFISRFTADHIVFNSNASLEAWLKAGGKKTSISYSYSGIDIPQMEEQLMDVSAIDSYKKKLSKDGKALIGIIGRLTSWKGQHIFLQAISKIDNVNAVIVGGPLFGEEDYEQKLITLVQELGIANRVTFLGHTNDVARVIASCDIITHCSIAPEPFGRVIVEAMLAGVPVIATNAGGAKEIVINSITGLLVPPGDVEALVNAINKLIDDPIWSKQLVSEARKRAKLNFSSEKMVDEFEKILEKL